MSSQNGLIKLVFRVKFFIITWQAKKLLTLKRISPENAGDIYCSIYKFEYSDGDIENVILDLVTKTEDKYLSSDYCIAHTKYNHWPIRYHLSPERANLVRHMNFAGKDVLEFGAGMGAVSRFVAENCRHLTVLEGSQRRFNVLSSRLRNLSNWDGFVKNYQDFTSDKKYDVVCFFGVLEYAGKYIDAKDPFRWAINHAKNFLKEDGLILIAIENKNGLKYFGGIAEDHYGVPFYGVNGYGENMNETKTFSRYEYHNMLSNCAFNRVDFHYPWPDYKIPNAIFKQEFVDSYPLVAASIAGLREFEDYSCPARKMNFSKELSLESIGRSGLLSEMSNSFLCIGSLKQESALLSDLTMDSNNIAYLYSGYNRVNHVTTIFRSDGTVKKDFTSSRDNVTKYNEGLQSTLPLIDKVYNNTTVLQSLIRHLHYNNMTGFENTFVEFLQWSFLEHATENGNMLMGNAVDAIMQNTIYVDGKFHNFDLEYVLNEKQSKELFLFRVILSLCRYRQFLYGKYNNMEAMYRSYCKMFKLSSSVSIRDMALAEAKIQAAVILGIDIHSTTRGIIRAFCQTRYGYKYRIAMVNIDTYAKSSLRKYIGALYRRLRKMLSKKH